MIENEMGMEKERLYELTLERRPQTVTMGPKSEVGKRNTFFRLKSEDDAVDETISRLLRGGYRMAATCTTEKDDDPKRIEEERYFEKKLEVVREILMRPQTQEKIQELLELKKKLQEDLDHAVANTGRIMEEHHSELKERDNIVPLSEIQNFRKILEQRDESKKEIIEKFQEVDKKVRDLREAIDTAREEERECKIKLGGWDRAFDQYGKELRDLIEKEQSEISL